MWVSIVFRLGLSLAIISVASATGWNNQEQGSGWSEQTGNVDGSSVDLNLNLNINTEAFTNEDHTQMSQEPGMHGVSYEYGGSSAPGFEAGYQGYSPYQQTTYNTYENPGQNIDFQLLQPQDPELQSHSLAHSNFSITPQTVYIPPNFPFSIEHAGIIGESSQQGGTSSHDVDIPPHYPFSTQPAAGYIGESSQQGRASSHNVNIPPNFPFSIEHAGFTGESSQQGGAQHINTYMGYEESPTQYSTAPFSLYSNFPIPQRNVNIPPKFPFYIDPAESSMQVGESSYPAAQMYDEQTFSRENPGIPFDINVALAEEADTTMMSQGSINKNSLLEEDKLYQSDSCYLKLNDLPNNHGMITNTIATKNVYPSTLDYIVLKPDEEIVIRCQGNSYLKIENQHSESESPLRDEDSHPTSVATLKCVDRRLLYGGRVFDKSEYECTEEPNPMMRGGRVNKTSQCGNEFTHFQIGYNKEPIHGHHFEVLMDICASVGTNGGMQTEYVVTYLDRKLRGQEAFGEFSGKYYLGDNWWHVNYRGSRGKVNYNKFNNW